MAAILEKCLCKAEGHLFSSRNSYVACRGAFCTASTPFCPDPATAARMWNAMMRAGRGQACEPTPDAAELARLRRVEEHAPAMRDALEQAQACILGDDCADPAEARRDTLAKIRAALKQGTKP